MTDLAPPSFLRGVIPSTFLASIAPALVARVLEGGAPLELRPGQIVAKKSRHPGVAIVASGLVRVYIASPERRQVTVRYARHGETLGLAHLYGSRIDVEAQAVTATTLFTLRAKRLRALAEEDAALANAIAKECSELVASAIDEVALLAFGSVRQLVARHLLDLASNDAGSDRLFAKITQQELADATGSVREVIARVLRDLDAAGVTKRATGGIVVRDAAQLDREARGAKV